MSTPLLIARTLRKKLCLLPRDGEPPRSPVRPGRENGHPAKLAESLSEIGTGLVAGVRQFNRCGSGGTTPEKLLERLKNIGITDWTPHSNPVVVIGISLVKGTVLLRATASDLGHAGRLLTSTTCRSAC